MSASTASWPSPAEARRATLVVLAALAALVGAWLLIHHGFYKHRVIIDTPLYQSYGDEMVAGRVPYRDFRLEYPPGALPVFVLPALLRHRAGDLHGFRLRFEALMLLCAVAALAAMTLVLRALRAPLPRVAAALGVAAVAPLALGPVILSRFDLWPAALTVGALAALASRRSRVGSGLLGLAVAAKIYPAVLLPLALAHAWKRGGRAEAWRCLAVFAGTLAVCFGPFVVLSPGGVWHSISRQLYRPLQLESLGSSLLIAAHHLGGLRLGVVTAYGSQNPVGDGTHAMQTASTVLQALVLLAVWIWFARSPVSDERLVLAAAASVCAFVAFGKVLSPQFMIWLIPLVPLVRGRRGALASGLVVAALVLTQIWFPYRYWALALHFAALPSWVLLARDLVLVATVAVLVWPARPRPDQAS